MRLEAAKLETWLELRANIGEIIIVVGASKERAVGKT